MKTIGVSHIGTTKQENRPTDLQNWAPEKKVSSYQRVIQGFK